MTADTPQVATASQGAHLARVRVRLGDCIVDGGRLRVERPDGIAPIPPRALEVLLELARHPGQTVARDALLDAIWADSFPTPDALSHAVKELRRALGDDRHAPRYVETVPRVGYRLVCAAELLAEPGPDAPAAVPPPHASVPGPAAARWRWIAAGTGLVVMLLLVAGWLRTGGSAGDAPLADGHVVPLTADPGWETQPALSPDGSAVAYMAAAPGSHAFRIHVRSVGALGSTRLSRHEAPDMFEAMPAWSGDGRRIAFLRYTGRAPARCRIVVSDVFAARETEIGPCRAQLLEHVAWDHDDAGVLLSRRIAGGSGLALHRLLLTGRTPVPLDYPRPDGVFDLEPKPSPDGHWIAFRRGSNPYTDLYLMRSDGSDLRRLTDWSLPVSRFTWLPDSRRLLVAVQAQQRGLRVLDIESGAVHDAGDAFRGALYPDAARLTHAVAFARSRTETRLTRRRRGEATAEPLLEAASSRSEWDVAVSPDERLLVFGSDRLGTPALLSARRNDVDSVRELARHEGLRPRLPVFSPDGTQVAYVAQGEARSEGWLVAVDGSGARRIGTDAERVRSVGFGADGRLLVASDRGGHWSLWLVDAHAQAWTPLDLPGAVKGMVAPDGALYFTRELDGALYRRDPVTGAVRQVADGLLQIEEGSWTLQADGIYAVRPASPNPMSGFALERLAWPATPDAAWEPVFMLPENFVSRHIALGSGGSVLYTAEHEVREADLFLWSDGAAESAH